MGIRVGVIGDFNSSFHSHHATGAAIEHAAAHLGIAAKVQWIPTPVFATVDPGDILRGYDALWASPGSPYLSFDGMLRGIRIARESNLPFVGT